MAQGKMSPWREALVAHMRDLYSCETSLSLSKKHITKRKKKKEKKKFKTHWTQMNAHEVAQSNSATSWIMEITNCYRCNTVPSCILYRMYPLNPIFSVYRSCFHSHSPSLLQTFSTLSLQKPFLPLASLPPSFFSPPHKSFPLFTPSSVKHTPPSYLLSLLHFSCCFIVSSVKQALLSMQSPSIFCLSLSSCHPSVVSLFPPTLLLHWLVLSLEFKTG